MSNRYGSPRKLDPLLAFKRYCQSKDNGYMRTYQDIADEFNVSLRTVQTWASRNDWVQKRHRILDKKLESYIYSFKYRHSYRQLTSY